MGFGQYFGQRYYHPFYASLSLSSVRTSYELPIAASDVSPLRNIPHCWYETHT